MKKLKVLAVLVFMLFVKDYDLGANSHSHALFNTTVHSLEVNKHDEKGKVSLNPLNFSLPPHSNLYPDNFAIQWYIEEWGSKIKLKRDETLQIEIEAVSAYDDVLFTFQPTRDSILRFEFDQKENLLYRAYRGSIIKNAALLSDLYLLKIVPVNAVVENLKSEIEADPSIENYMKLISEYEKMECYANLTYVLQKVLEKDSGTALLYWQELKFKNQYRFGNDRVHR